MDAEDVIREARTWVDTPYIHQARVKHKGVDCVGIVIGIGRDLKLLPRDFEITGYSPTPVSNTMGGELDKYLDRIDKKSMRGGDILWMLYGGKYPQHLAILTNDRTIIHANNKIGSCKEHILDEKWVKRIRRVYRYRGLE